MNSTEEKILDATLSILEKEGENRAYNYLVENYPNVVEPSSQMFNFLYCLAASSGKGLEALQWMKEAIIEKGMWYRPEVFEDSDLDSIRNTRAFKDFKEISLERYLNAKRTAKTLTSWKEIYKGKLALILHGNQQNYFSNRKEWEFLNELGYQVEFVQSKIIDSCNLFRWEDDGETQLDGIIENLDWEKYNHHMIGGFSAGCNEILKTLVKGEINSEEVILVSPWLPFINNSDETNSIYETLQNTKISIICGSEDSDCLPYAKLFHKEAVSNKLECNLHIVEGLGHQFPEEGLGKWF